MSAVVCNKVETVEEAAESLIMDILLVSSSVGVVLSNEEARYHARRCYSTGNFDPNNLIDNIVLMRTKVNQLHFNSAKSEGYFSMLNLTTPTQ